MNYFDINDINNLQQWIKEAIELKKSPLAHKNLGQDKTICLLFFNNSLRTRLSTQKAAMNLGMNVMVMNFGSEGWQLEYENGEIMDQGKSEHVIEAAQVVSQYADIIAIRAFAKFENKEDDYKEQVLKSFMQYATVPVLNMESSIGHPLQALTDMITIAEHNIKPKPKVVLSWAPHPKALPQAVANSFAQYANASDFEFVITHPKGYELDPQFTGNAIIEYDQDKAFKEADFIYVKNWSPFADENYGKVINTDTNWKISAEKMAKTNNAKFMHCLPVRRNVIVDDAVIDSENSLVIQQANNRTFAAQIAIKKILEAPSRPSLKGKE